LDILRTISIVDVLDVIVLAILFYQVLSIFHRSRASQLILGLFYFVLLFLIAFILGMTATLWVFERLAGLLAVALIVIFQPELRNFFSRAGRRKLFRSSTSATEREEAENLIETIVQALEEMSDTHTGALIVIERDISLEKYINTGEKIDAEVRKDLLKAIFYKGNPLHDGAVIISDHKIVSARSFLPLSDSRDIPSHLGTRHRAALGITEIDVSDAISLVASEETGHLSMFHAGKPAFRLTPNTMRHMVEDVLIPEASRGIGYSHLTAEIGKYFKFGKRRHAESGKVVLPVQSRDTGDAAVEENETIAPVANEDVEEVSER